MRSVFGILAVAASLLVSVPSPVPAQGPAAGPVAVKKKFLSIPPAEAKKMIETREDLLLIDVRSPEEYAQGALPGSRLVPFWKIMKGDHDLPRDRPILLVCAVGGRSYSAGRYLSMKGYTEIYNLSGGLSAWAKQRVPLPQRRPQQTDQK